MFAFILISENETILNHDLCHNHPPDIKKLSRQAISNACKRKAVDDICVRPAKVINIQVADSSYKENLTTNDLNLIRHNINRSRLRIMPAIARNIEEVHKAVISINPLTDRQESFLLDNDAENNIIIFSCFSNLKCLSGSDTYYMDGTFKYSTKFFFQLFTIHCLRNGHYIPLVFCLLPNKHSHIYEEVFKRIIRLAETMNISLNPSRIILDFETAIHKAVKTAWPFASIFGCRFHLAQSWFRKIQSLGLVPTYRKSDSNGKWLHHLFGLPFLPPERVSECFVNDFMADLPNSNSFSKMADYIVENYISEDAAFPPAMWASNTSHLYLTTNSCESFHSHFSDSFYHTHPNINIFVKTLLQLQTSIYIKVQSINTRVIVKTKRVKDAETFLQEQLTLLRENKITDYEFVKLVSHRYKINHSANNV